MAMVDVGNSSLQRTAQVDVLYVRFEINLSDMQELLDCILYVSPDPW